MTIAQAFNEIAVAQGGTAAKSGNIASAIDALNDALAGSDQKAATTIEGAVRLLGAHIGGGVAPSGTISITENGEGIDVAQYAYADVNVSGGGGTSTHKLYVLDARYLQGDSETPNYPTIKVDSSAVEMSDDTFMMGGQTAPCKSCLIQAGKIFDLNDQPEYAEYSAFDGFAWIDLPCAFPDEGYASQLVMSDGNAVLFVGMDSGEPTT